MGTDTSEEHPAQGLLRSVRARVLSSLMPSEAKDKRIQELEMRLRAKERDLQSALRKVDDVSERLRMAQVELNKRDNPFLGTEERMTALYAEVLKLRKLHTLSRGQPIKERESAGKCPPPTS